MAKSVYEIVTDKIIDQLEKGVIPWRKPWGTTGTGGLPKNGITGRKYSGINLLMLEWGETYYTWNEIQEHNHEAAKKKEPLWKIKKGSKASIVVFFTLVENKKSKNPEKPEQIPIYRYYNVFASNDIEGIDHNVKTYEHDPITEAEEIAFNFKEVPVHHHNNNRAFYSPMEDYINVPSYDRFEHPEEYYSTLFHEMTHSTGHESRLKRFVGSAKNASKGSKAYSFEELIAELGAAFLCGHCGIVNKTIDNSAAYIDSWLKVLKEDKTAIIRAAGKASKAADYIRGDLATKEAN